MKLPLLNYCDQIKRDKKKNNDKYSVRESKIMSSKLIYFLP